MKICFSPFITTFSFSPCFATINNYTGLTEKYVATYYNQPEDVKAVTKKNIGSPFQNKATIAA